MTDADEQFIDEDVYTGEAVEHSALDRLYDEQARLFLSHAQLVLAEVRDPLELAKIRERMAMLEIEIARAIIDDEAARGNPPVWDQGLAFKTEWHRIRQAIRRREFACAPKHARDSGSITSSRRVPQARTRSSRRKLRGASHRAGAKSGDSGDPGGGEPGLDLPLDAQVRVQRILDGAARRILAEGGAA